MGAGTVVLVLLVRLLTRRIGIRLPDLLLAVVATAVALALLLAAGDAAGQESSPPTQSALVQAVDDTDADAVQKVREAAP